MMRSAWIIAVVGSLTARALAQPDQGGTPPPPSPPDDLSKAADAAAEAAAVGADTPADLAKAADAAADLATLPPDATKPSADDIDLSALGLDPAATTFDDKLNIYGFADVAYTSLQWKDETPGLTDTRAFAVGNLNIYLSKNLAAKARSLAEVRFTFMPNGSQNADGSFVNTTAQDISNFSRPAQWGGIVVERAYVEYDLLPQLTARAGHWLTPYGIWNIDHGSPAILSSGRPYIIGEQFFPEHQTGVDLFGTHYVSDVKLGGHLTVSNGRGGTEAVSDLDNKLAFGGRVDAELPWGVKIGGSYYRGRFTSLPPAAGAQPETFLEASYAGDVQVKYGSLQLQSEVIARERHYVAGQRMTSAAGFVPDGRDFGLYVLAAYRLDRFWNVTPFGYYEYYRPLNSPYYTKIQSITGGLNFRPTPSLVFKAQFNIADFADGPELLGGQQILYLATQASWVF